ncbi:MAG: PaaI family thioesterase [Salinivirgaceae bacterium]|jgi:uncharacterized protein (TIGR00369 family)|nr:PaaI family thioesterase [Salinivirgaceae bacterium]
MKKLANPYAKLEGYNCFGCAPKNPNGLQLDFYEDGDEITTQWQPENQFAGFHNVLHGGIQATLMDEIANWVVVVKTATSGMTIELNTKFLKAVKIEKEQPITVRARLIEKEEKKAIIHAQIFNFAGELCSESNVVYYLFPPAVAARKLFYPGREAFYEE